jgi:hypothetical protein
MDLYVLPGPVGEFLERFEGASASVDRNNLGIEDKGRYILGNGEELLSQVHNVRVLPRRISGRKKFGGMLNLFGHLLQMPGKQADRMFSGVALLGMYLHPLTIVFELRRKGQSVHTFVYSIQGSHGRS